MNRLEEFDEYVKQLKEHDWFFEYSDCENTYRAGLKSYGFLLTKQSLNNDFSKAFHLISLNHTNYCRATLERMRNQIKEEMVEALITPVTTE